MSPPRKVSEYWSDGVLDCRGTGVLEYWSVGVLNYREILLEQREIILKIDRIPYLLL